MIGSETNRHLTIQTLNNKKLNSQNKNSIECLLSARGESRNSTQATSTREHAKVLTLVIRCGQIRKRM